MFQNCIDERDRFNFSDQSTIELADPTFKLVGLILQQLSSV